MTMKGISVAGQTASEAAWSIFMFALSIAVTAAFGYALATDPEKLTAVWEWSRSLPLIAQALIWLLFLPWMIALWVWSMPWALALRVVLVVAILGFTNWLLFPWK